MKIRTKILAGFMAVVLMSVLIGVAGFVTTKMLSDISHELQIIQVEGASISDILNAHYVWRQALTEAVLNGADFSGSLDSNTCALGQWQNSPEARQMDDPELLRLLDSLAEPHKFIHTEAQKVVEFINAGDYESARLDLNENILPRAQEVISILTEMQSRYSILTSDESEQVAGIENLVNIINTALVVIAIVVGVFFAVFIANMVSKPLAPLTAFMDKAGHRGDLEPSESDTALIRKYADNKDELGQLIRGANSFIGRVVEVSKELETITGGDFTVDFLPLSEKDTIGNSLHKLLESFNKMFEDIHKTTVQVSSGAVQIAASAQSLAQGATEQAATVDELSESMQEISEQTKRNAAVANEAKDLGESIKADAEQGSLQMGQMMKAVQEISDSSKSIGNVIKIIDDIAFQTNILALNAAVEAARAGQHGKGFAVVADEVRSLAAKSAEAAKNTSALIATSIEKSEQGAKISAETSESLDRIVQGIMRSSELNAGIAKSSDEQSAGIGQISEAINQVSQVVQQNSATAEESAAASEQMSTQSNVLENLISQFKRKESSKISSFDKEPSKQTQSTPAGAGMALKLDGDSKY
ncbi:MAG: methyl-accepting chemotaxis protein [Clostridiales bacterium]|nr:methyl-accepting chemotaxis protein [Clostridiales bacterium]